MYSAESPVHISFPHGLLGGTIDGLFWDEGSKGSGAGTGSTKPAPSHEQLLSTSSNITCSCKAIGKLVIQFILLLPALLDGVVHSCA